jgi:hypothetical protein
MADVIQRSAEEVRAAAPEVVAAWLKEGGLSELLVGVPAEPSPIDGMTPEQINEALRRGDLDEILGRAE